MAAHDIDSSLWNGGVIPYVIDPDHGAEASILALINELEQTTNLRFVKRQYQEDYLRFDRNTTGNANADDNGRGSPRKLRNSLENMGVWRHEMGHVLGLAHEQQRSDRDGFVRIHWDRIPESEHSQYEMARTDNTTPYDYRSIMHYNVGDQANPNMDILDPAIDPADVGTGSVYSAGDLATINRLYGDGPGPVRRSSGEPHALQALGLSVVAKAWPDSPGNTQVFMATSGEGRLVLHRWRVGVDGSVRSGPNTGNQHGHASNVQLALVGDRLVGAMRDADGGLYLISWSDDLAKLADSGNLAGEAHHVRIVALDTSHFVTACMKGNGRVALILWRLQANGGFVRVSDSGDQGDGAKSLDLVLLRLNGREHILATLAQLPTDDRVHVTTWAVSTDGGQIVRRGDSAKLIGKADLIRGVAVNGTLVVVCRNDSGKLLLIPLDMRDNGSAVERGDESNDGGAGHIHTLSVLARPYGLLTLVRAADGEVLLIKWALRNGRMRRLGSSGEQAGHMLIGDLCTVPGSTTAPVCTAVTTPNKFPMLITWDDMGGPGELYR